MSTVPNSYIIVTKEGAAAETADAIKKLAADNNRDDVQVNNVMKIIGVVAISAPADFIAVIQKTLGDKIESIEAERTVGIPENNKPKRKGGKPPRFGA